jgi:hypothetical protein
MISPSIYDFAKSRENEFEADEVRVGDNWDWNLRRHVQMIFHLKNSVFYTGENDWMRAFKAVMRPLLRLSYWTEDIEVKDVTFFIENADGRVLSFLVKKYYEEVYTREHNIDTLFDEVTESDIDFGGALVQRTNKQPMVIPLNSIAFCDQTDILGGPIGFKHFYSPDALRKMSKVGWGEESNGATISLEDLAVLADDEKTPDGMNDTKRNKVPGKTVEVYIIRGNLPEHYLEDNDNMEDWYNQLQIIAFYTDKKKKRVGVTLYRKKEDEANLMFHASEKIHGRGLGFSDGEMLLHPQVWTNYMTIQKTELLKAASKVIIQTDDENYAGKNNLQDMENLEVTTLAEGRRMGFVPTVGAQNIQVISNAVNEWFEAAQLDSAAFDPILGKEQSSGTTFRGQERTVAQGRGWHDRRRGQRAKFLEEIHRTMIIPDMVKEIRKGKKFLATLSTEELSWVQDQLSTLYANNKLKQSLIEGKMVSAEDKKTLITTFKDQFSKRGGKHLLEILEGELDGIELKMGINIANKQKDLVNLSDKILSIFQFVFANPTGFQQAMQIPALAKSFNDILEFSGLSQSDFLTLTQPPSQPVPSPVQPQQEMQLNQQEQ